MIFSILISLISNFLRKAGHALLVLACLGAGLVGQSCQKVAPLPSAEALAKAQQDHILHYLDSIGIEPSRIIKTGTETYSGYLVKDTLVPGGRFCQNGMTLMVRYRGHVLDSTKIFDENYSDPEPFRFDLGTNDVIKGWNEAFTFFHIGETGRLFIPSNLGYGATAQTNIPANSILYFEVKVVNAQ